MTTLSKETCAVLDGPKVLGKWVKGFKGVYTVTPDGEIISSRRSGTPERIKKQVVSQFGYKYVNLCKNNKPRNYFVHRIIAEAFIENPHKKPFVNHKNGIKTDNSLNNLEWCTARENAHHSIKVLGNDFSNDKNGRAVLTNREVEFLRFLKGKYPQISSNEIAKFYKVTGVTIRDAWSKRTWKKLQ